MTHAQLISAASWMSMHLQFYDCVLSGDIDTELFSYLKEWGKAIFISVNIDLATPLVNAEFQPTLEH